MKEKDRKFYLASVTDRFVRGQMDRRSFLRTAGTLGLGATALGMGFGSRPFGGDEGACPGTTPAVRRSALLAQGRRQALCGNDAEARDGNRRRRRMPSTRN
ncbi:hypothetical protein Q1M64_31335 [Sinorhizobium meliloti]|nr:hypothetical protein Q1M64_31335 [Sinorhizobium meliloti]